MIEALRRCQGYHACDPTLQISLVLNAPRRTSSRLRPVRRTRSSRCRTRASAVPTEARGRALRANPARLGLRRPPPARERIRTRLGSRACGATTTPPRRHFRRASSVGVAGQSPPAVRASPDSSGSYCRRPSASVRAASSPGGVDRGDAGRERRARTSIRRPRLGSLVLDELERRFPDASFALVGRLGRQAGGRSSGIARGEVDRLLASRRHAIDAFDRPILDQLAAGRGVRASSCLRTRGSASPPLPSARRGSRSREATGTSTSSTACRSTRCCPRAAQHPAFVARPAAADDRCGRRRGGTAGRRR